MAFPGTYNINYYKGDTHEFRIYPKNNAGEVFDLAGYDITRFTIAPRRGTLLAGESRISAYAYVDPQDSNYITCAIRVEDGEQMLAANSPYYYDVEIQDQGPPYNKVYTLLTGQITVEEQVSPKITVPNNVKNITLGSATSTTIPVTWELIDGGPIANGYKAYIGTTSVFADAYEATAGEPSGFIATTSYTFTKIADATNLSPLTQYYIWIIATNTTGDSSPVSATFSTAGS